MVMFNGASDIITAMTKYYESLSVHRREEMLSMTSVGSAFKPYYRPDQLLVAMPETKPLRKLYSDPEPAASSPGESHGGNKSRRKRTTFTQQQAAVLEREYLTERYMVRDKRTQLADSLGLSEAQVKTWFQNRRAKDKREKKTDSPQRSPSDSANVSVADDSVLENSLSSSLMSPSPSAVEPATTVTAPTPPSQVKPAPATSPMLQNHQVLTGLLQGRPLPEYPQYFVNLGLPHTEPPAFLPNPVIKPEIGCGEGPVKDIYKMPTNIYEQNFPSIYTHIPFGFNPVTSSHSPGYVPEPLAPIASDDNLAAEHTQLTAL
ncbi:homeobox domain protein [Teladorsagia circumcincta]|uniref:Homeobox domain protein n=1 Tax=Teladorsagia circumcincta TaxID=45464 RepID=A0A2G9UZU0_TELCI|nr:homeobox domain protein [Teladorsagia circumcincta]